jgi:hypothetical protein
MGYYVLKLLEKNPNKFTRNGLYVWGSDENGLLFSMYIDKAVKFIDFDEIDLYLTKSKTKHKKEDFNIEYYSDNNNKIASFRYN